MMKIRIIDALKWILLVLCFFANSSSGELINFEITKVESPAFDGKSFDQVGQYEMITARATIAVDPEHRLNKDIVDLHLAQRNTDGRVEAIADVVILKPIDLTKGNGRLFYEVLNRGDKISLVLMNDAPWETYYEELNPGNGYMMRQGYSLVWSGWQGDIPPGKNRMTLQVPILEEIVGTVRDEIIFNHNHNPFVASLSYPANTLKKDKASLTIRQRQTDVRMSPDDLSFDFFYLERSGLYTSTPNQIIINRPESYDANAIYEFTYEAKDPLVMGLAFAATRDIVSFLRREKRDAKENKNPLIHDGKLMMKYAYGLGISQSGRFVRDFLYQGFNEDEKGRIVFDALMPDVAGSRKTWTNFRFAQPGRYSREHESHLQPGDQFPFSYAILEDPLTGKQDGILKRCMNTNTCPKVFHTDTATEFWQARSSLVVTDTRGNDIQLPSNVRAYFMASTEHSVGFGGVPTSTESCQQLNNPLHNGGPMRALLHALDLWVSDDIEPPDSEYPSRSNGTLVSPDTDIMNYPLMTGFDFQGTHNGLRVTDYSRFPPHEGAHYPIFVPKVDEDGNDIAGIRLPEVQVPTATYLGWNLTRPNFARGALCSVTGSTIPFPSTKNERESTEDSRLSIEERYPTHEYYVQKIREATESLLKKRFLLEEDKDLYIKKAQDSNIGK